MKRPPFRFTCDNMGMIRVDAEFLSAVGAGASPAKLIAAHGESATDGLCGGDVLCGGPPSNNAICLGGPLDTICGGDILCGTPPQNSAC